MNCVIRIWEYEEKCAAETVRLDNGITERGRWGLTVFDVAPDWALHRNTFSAFHVFFILRVFFTISFIPYFPLALGLPTLDPSFEGGVNFVYTTITIIILCDCL